MPHDIEPKLPAENQFFNWSGLSEELKTIVLENVKNPVDAIHFSETSRENRELIANNWQVWTQHGTGKALIAPRTLQQAWVVKASSLPKDVKLAIPQLELPLNIFSDNDVSLFFDMRRRIRIGIWSCESGTFYRVKYLFNRALFFAQQVGQSVPPEDYARAMHACVNKSIRLAERNSWYLAE